MANVDNLNFNDIFDMQNFQFIQNSFCDATGLAAVAVSKDGYATIPSNFTNYYLNFHKGKDNIYLIKEKYDNFKTNIFKSTIGILNFEIPLIVKGMHIGSIFGGQVLESPFNEDDVRSYANSSGIDPEYFLENIKELQVIPHDKVLSATKFLSAMLYKIISDWEKQEIFSSSYLNIINTTEDVKNCLSEFYKTSNDLNLSQENLVTEIENINGILIEINSIVKAVSSLADETQMISFNASIEAARAGEQGKSFTVIAGEIRRLSEQSKKTVANIQNFTATIQNSISKTTVHSKDCIESINSEITELNKINGHINNILENLNKMR